MQVCVCASVCVCVCVCVPYFLEYTPRHPGLCRPIVKIRLAFKQSWHLALCLVCQVGGYEHLQYPAYWKRLALQDGKGLSPKPALVASYEKFENSDYTHLCTCRQKCHTLNWYPVFFSCTAELAPII